MVPLLQRLQRASWAWVSLPLLQALVAVADLGDLPGAGVVGDVVGGGWLVAVEPAQPRPSLRAGYAVSRGLVPLWTLSRK
jgi:hypothetical protein